MNTDSYLPIALFGIGTSVLIFSVWSHILIRRHLKQFNSSHRFQSSLTDERYFELKSKQDYIIAASTIIISVITFLGIQSIKDIKENLNTEMANERKQLEAIRNEAKGALKEYQILKDLTGNYSDSVNSAFQNVTLLNSRINSILSKNVIQQNIFITKRFNLKSLPGDKDGRGIRTIYFKDLYTITGEHLPTFTTPPNIICISNSNASIFVSDVTTTSFKAFVGSSVGFENTTEEQEAARPILVETWISSSPPKQ